MESSTIQTKLKKHVAVLTFPFTSHPIALLDLVKKLAITAPDTQFSFFSFADSNNSLFSASNNLPSNIKPYNIGNGVPSNHVFSGHPVERLDLFIKAAPNNYKNALEQAVEDMGQFNCLITDALLTFAGAIANEFNVSWIPVWIALPHTLCLHMYTGIIRESYGGDDGDKSTKESKTLDNIPGLSKIRVEDIPDEIVPSNKQETLFFSMLAQIGHVLPQATAVVVGFFEEFYPKPLLDYLKSRIPRLLNVGVATITVPPPLLPLSSTDTTGCLQWLDNQKTMSVAYISFGTAFGVPPNEIKEVAEALQESKIPFLWSIKEDLRGNFPNRFIEKTSNHGKVVSWCPQGLVLAHKSVGVLLTNCGAKSILESMGNGVPMICRPVFADNMVNARLVEEIWEAGVRVDGGVVTKNGVIKNLKYILEDEDGRAVRKKVKELQQLILKASAPNGNAAQDFKNLVEML